MKIYTSYFANIKNLEAADIVPVGICFKVPKFFDNPNLMSAAPTSSILFEYKNSDQSEAAQLHYKERYINEVLCVFRFHPEYFIDTLKFISKGKDVALCCYETPDDFCHRHLFAEYFNSLMPELNIEEYPIYPKKKSSNAKSASKSDSIPTPVSDALF